MLSEEEKKAIEIVKSWINCFENQEDETPKIHKTVLNLITKLQKENNLLNNYVKENEIYKKNLFNYAEKKDKQIDLMAEFISKYHCFEVAVYDLDDECTHKHECKNCIKQYFENKAKGE